MRERIEDLGRLAVMLEKIIDHEVWNAYDGRPKDIFDNFQEMDEEEQEELLRTFVSGLSDVKEELLRCSEIANGDECDDDE